MKQHCTSTNTSDAARSTLSCSTLCNIWSWYIVTKLITSWLLAVGEALAGSSYHLGAWRSPQNDEFWPVTSRMEMGRAVHKINLDLLYIMFGSMKIWNFCTLFWLNVNLYLLHTVWININLKRLELWGRFKMKWKQMAVLFSFLCERTWNH